MAFNKILSTYLCVFLLVMDLVDCQTLEKALLVKGLYTAARIKTKAKDKGFLFYGLGAVKKAGKGAVEGIIAKPLKLVGVVLGPLGLPLKLVGTVLKAKSVAHKSKAVVLTVKKYSRDSVRYG